MRIGEIINNCHSRESGNPRLFLALLIVDPRVKPEDDVITNLFSVILRVPQLLHLAFLGAHVAPSSTKDG